MGRLRDIRWAGAMLERLDENVGSDSVNLTDADLQTIDDAASKITVQGARLPEHVLKLTNG